MGIRSGDPHDRNEVLFRVVVWIHFICSITRCISLVEGRILPLRCSQPMHLALQLEMMSVERPWPPLRAQIVASGVQ
jgi:hypothetical protein